MKERAYIDNQLISQQRAAELKSHAASYLTASDLIPTGFKNADMASAKKSVILKVLNGSEEDWNNWKWQIRNRITDSYLLAELLGLAEIERKRIERVSKLYRWAISPYYLSLIDDNYESSPIYLQSVPDIRELDATGCLDPMNEALTSPAPCITRRYPDRLIINVTNQCPMYCRHCQRRRNIGQIDHHSRHQDIMEALDYIAANLEIRDVLLTGGDALMLDNNYLDWLLNQLEAIPHVEIKRIGTRAPVTLPQRITRELCDILRKYAPIYLNTQFNHPLEVTPEAKKACDMLVEAGVVLGNQMVLLKGVNDDPNVVRKLNHELLKIRVRPYYIFHAKNVRGTRHFQTSVSKGLEIMESLRGRTSGLAVPTFIVNAPGGLGKIPVMPNHIVDKKRDKIVLRTWEGKIVEIEEPSEEES